MNLHCKEKKEKEKYIKEQFIMLMEEAKKEKKNSRMEKHYDTSILFLFCTVEFVSCLLKHT